MHRGHGLLLIIILLALLVGDSLAQGRGRRVRRTAPDAAASLSSDASSLFLGAGWCTPCHVATGPGLVVDGQDISPVHQWRSTMMAQSARDPVWRATVAAEVAEHPGLQELIEDRCTTCHAPMGRYQAVSDGQVSFSIAHLEATPLARDGVSCTLCHQIQPGNLGEAASFTGGFRIHGDREIFGPYEDPLTGPMSNHVSYLATHGPHVHRSALCGTCHTLFTPILDDQGQIIGEFPEQTPYLEWRNSRYAQEGISCQACHMPRLGRPVDIATRPPWHRREREPYWMHEFVGGNTLVPRLLRTGSQRLRPGVEAAQLETTVSQARGMLERALELDVRHRWEAGKLVLEVEVTNRTGHKLPTGIPLRRLWLHVTVTDRDDTTRFESGGWDRDGRIHGIDPEYEPHHLEITRADQVQIYEGVTADASGAVTRSLLRAASFRKDNRIPPQGFTTDRRDHDSCGIAGRASEDGDFNRADGTQGTGADVVRYRLDLSPAPYRIQVEACYQTLSPRSAEHLLRTATREAELLGELLDGQDLTPIVIGSARDEVPPGLEVR